MDTQRKRLWNRARYHATRQEILDVYGHACACCGTTKALQIDHIHGDGKSHRLELGGRLIGSWLREHGYPADGFQILCRPCNLSKRDGLACQIDHSMDMMNEYESLGDESRQELSKSPAHMVSDAAGSDPLELFSTRIHASTKVALLKQAKDRGVAAGVIVEEILYARMHDKTPETLVRIEAKLDALLHQTTLPPTAEMSHEPLAHRDPHSPRWTEIALGFDQAPDPPTPTPSPSWLQKLRGRR